MSLTVFHVFPYWFLLLGEVEGELRLVFGTSFSAKKIDG